MLKKGQAMLDDRGTILYRSGASRRAGRAMLRGRQAMLRAWKVMLSPDALMVTAGTRC
jgi:hypothetical protein